MNVASSRARQEGAALLTTLILVAAIALVVVGLFSVNRQEVEITGLTLTKTRADLAEKAAFQDASSLLRSLTAADQYLVTTQTTGSGQDLTRYHFISTPTADEVIHVPLFAGGKLEKTTLPNLNETSTSQLASKAVAAPLVSLLRTDAVERIELPALTHLSTNGRFFPESRFPLTGFIELDGQNPAQSQNPNPRTRHMGTRYTYWIEDLEGYPNVELSGSWTDYHATAVDALVPDQFRGGYSRHDSRTDPSNLQDAGLRLPSSFNPESFYQFPKAFRGQALVDQVAPGLSPSELSFNPWPTGTHTREEHPYFRLSSVLPTAMKALPANAAQLERRRFVTGLSPYLVRPHIPYGHGYPDAGLPAYNLNSLIAAKDMKIAGIIERNLPEFENRKGGFPDNTVNPALKDYTATIAASLIDYADIDSLPSLPSNTINSSGQQFRGVDAYCPVNEFFVKFEYRGYRVRPGGHELEFVARPYAEFWNTFNRTVEMKDVTLKFRFIEPIRFRANTIFHRIEETDLDKDDPFTVPVSITIPPNGYLVQDFGEMRWRVFVPGDPSSPIAFPIVQDIRGISNVSVRAGYELFLGGQKVDGSGRTIDSTNAQHGFFFSRNLPIMSPGEHIMRMATPALDPRAFGFNAGFGAHLGDPWMPFYSASTGEDSLYRNKATPGARNVDTSKVTNSRPDWFKDQTRVRDWPDRGYDNPVGTTPTKDDQMPDTFPSLTDPRLAPWRISNSGRYFSLSELGNIHDPVMWVYGESTGTNSVIAKQSNQFYRDPLDQALQNPWLTSLPLGAEPGPGWGGGNTLRIGRPEHELFDRPGMRASQLLDLFHVGFNGTNLSAADPGETDLLYENFDPGDHRPLPSALTPGEAATLPHALVYESELSAQGDFSRRLGQLNINTAPTLFEIEALLRGPFASSDIEIDPSTANAPITPIYNDAATLGEAGKGLKEDAIPHIAAGLYRARPFYSPSHLARVLSQLIHEHDALPPHHNDAEAEETFARIFNTTSFSSRHFRIYTYAETYQRDTEMVLSRSRRVYEVFLDPIRDAGGDITGSKLRVISATTL